MAEQDADLEDTFRSIRQFMAHLLAMLRRTLARWPVLVVAAMAGGVAAYFVPKYIKPIYLAQTVVAYRETVDESLVGRNRPANAWLQKSASYRDALMTRANLSKLIEDLGLYPEIVASAGMAEAVEEFKRNLTLSIRESQTITIMFRANNRKTPVEVVERLTEELKQLPGKLDAARATATKEFLQKQLEGIAEQLEQKETALSLFLAQHPEFAGTTTTLGTVSREMHEATPEAAGTSGSAARVAALRRQLARLEQQLRDPGSAPPPPPRQQLSPEDRARIGAAEREVAQAQANLQAKRARFTDKHPDVAAAQQRLDRAQATLRTARQAVVVNTPDLPASYGGSTDEVKQQIEEIKRAIIVQSRLANDKTPARDLPANDAATQVVELETEWVALKRDVETVQQQYHEVQARLFSATTLETLQASGGSGLIEVVDPPMAPTNPAARGPRRVAATAFAVALVIGALIALFLVMNDDRLYDGHDLRGLRLGPIVQAVPALARKGGKPGA